MKRYDEKNKETTKEIITETAKTYDMTNCNIFTNANANAIAYAKVYTKPTIWSMQWLNKKMDKITK